MRLQEPFWTSKSVDGFYGNDERTIEKTEINLKFLQTRAMGYHGCNTANFKLHVYTG
jgi:hypothetical protein